MYTMGDVAKCSYYNEKELYDLFGINAELLIDHAWGWEPCTMDYIKVYRPTTNCLSSGQVLHEPYTFDKALLVATEMADMLALDLVAKHLVTDQLVLTTLNLVYTKFCKIRNFFCYSLKCSLMSDLRRMMTG